MMSIQQCPTGQYDNGVILMKTSETNSVEGKGKERTMQKRLLLFVLLSLSVFAIGCVQDMGDIDRTQPNKLRKTVFEGEWYMRQTVTDVPGTGNMMFIGYEGNTERVRFAIEENLLVAHRVHEDVTGIDTSVVPTLNGGGSLDSTYDESTFVGAPVAAFPIQSHFDVQRSYNSSTGEQSNVLSENSTDRPWNDREWLRVNWSNKIFSAGAGFTATLNVLSMGTDWYANGSDENTPLYVECKDKDGQFVDCDPDNLSPDDDVAYIELTNEFVVESDWIECLLTFGVAYVYGADCGPETIQVTTSFMKVDPVDAASYEPRLYNDREFDWFGYFRTERCAYDRLYGCRDQTTVQLANRHNIWKTWFEDADGDHQYTDGIDRRLPYTERDTRPIAYYLSEVFPGDLMDEALKIGDQYNEAFQNVVRNTKDQNFSGRMFYVCANSGSDAEKAVFDAAVADGTLEDTTVWTRLMQGYDDGVCLRQGKSKRFGDMRYSYLGWIDSPQQQGPLGYGPSSVDPISGETVTGTAYIYGASIDTWAQSAVDLMEIINGEIDAEDYGYGVDLDGYFADAAQKLHIPETGEAAVPGILSNMPTVDRERFERFNENLSSAVERRLEPKFAEVMSMDPSHLVRFTDRHREIWERMKGTPVESAMITPEIKVGLGAGVFSPDDPTNEEMIEALTPRKTGLAPGNGFHPKSTDPLRADYWDRFDKFARNNIFMAEFIDDKLLGLAMELKDKFKDIQDPTERRLRMFYYVRSFVYKHVTEHEVGHTVGLRHNFEASTDAMSYNPKYWEIRFEGDTLLKSQHLPCPGVPSLELGDHHCPSRGVITQDDQKRMREYSYSSTMDYGRGQTATSKGIGLYDQAAIAYAYGELVHVFKEGSEPTKFKLIVDGNGDLVETSALHPNVVETTSEVITDWSDVELLEYVCGAGLTNCNDECVDRQSDPANCGACGTTCDPGEVCGKGVCVSSCQAGLTSCSSGSCMDLLKDSANCGTCGTACAPGDVCDAGVCELDPNFVNGGMDYWHYTVLPLMFHATTDMNTMYDREYVSLKDYNPESPTRTRVPYRFCSDELRGANPNCQVWDDGADYNEIVDNYAADYEGYYFVNSFRHGRAGWGLWLWPYISRLNSRYFSPMATMYQHWVVRASSWGATWQLNPYAGGLQQVGVEVGLRTLLNVLATPHPGTYELVDTDNDGVDMYMNLSTESDYEVEDVPETELLRLDPGMKAKHRIARFDYDSGYYYFYKYEIMSSFFDRYAALMALTNPEYNDIGVDANSDITGYLIPYYLLYSYELSTVFGGIMAEDWSTFAPVLNLQKVTAGSTMRDAVEYRDPLAPISKRVAYTDPTKYAPINPYPGSYGNSGFTDRYYAAVFGLSFFQVLYDQSFNHASNVFIMNDGGSGFEFADSDGDGMYDVQEGSEDYNGDGLPAMLDPTEVPPAGQESALPTFVTYEDPFNHKVYAAVKYTQTSSPLYSPGVELIDRANRIKAAWKKPNSDTPSWEVQNAREDIENVMLINQVFGYTGKL